MGKLAKPLKIGFVTQWFDPETGAAAIPGVIARTLQRRGVQIHVVTGMPSYPAGRIHPDYKRKGFMSEDIDGIKVHRVPILASHNDKAVSRGLMWMTYAANASVVAPMALAGCDAVLVHMSPATAALPAAVLKLARRIPYVLHIEDLWPDTVMAFKDLIPHKRHPLELALHAMCDSLYKGAHSIAVSSPGMTDKIADRGIQREKVFFAPNWADESIFGPICDTSAAKQELNLQAPTTVMYAGNLGRFQELETFIKVASILRNVTSIEFVLVGNGIMETKLHQLVNQLRLPNVIFRGSRPMSEMRAVMAAGDIHYIGLANRPLFSITLPSKVQATLASGRAVVASVSGDPAHVIASAGGRVTTLGDAHALAEFITSLAEDRSALLEAQQTARQYYVDNLSEEVGARTLIRLLTSAAEEQSH